MLNNTLLMLAGVKYLTPIDVSSGQLNLKLNEKSSDYQCSLVHLAGTET